jgi:hypothetical protein
MLQEGKKRGLEIMLKAHFPYEFSRNTTGSGHSGKKKRRHNAACKKPQCGSCLQGDRREQGRVNSHQEEPRAERCSHKAKLLLQGAGGEGCL